MRKTIVFLSVILFAACNKNSGDVNELSEIKSVTCEMDTTQKYSIYLPMDYKKNQKYPIIFCFDPHARGELPLELLKEKAEQHGFILAGSNSSENNQANNNYVVQSFINDVYQNYSIDQNRVYALGFSGGGRIAARVALSRPECRGAISCAAGMPVISEGKLGKEIFYFGIVGVHDFNFLEMYQMDQDRKSFSSEIDMFIKYFEGGHEWPPKSVIGDVIDGIVLYEMREETRNKDQQFIKQQIKGRELSIEKLIEEKKYLAAMNKVQESFYFLKHLTKLDGIKQYVRELNRDKDYNAQKEEREQYIQKEMQSRYELQSDFMKQDLDWWNKYVENLNVEIEEAESYKRNFLYRQKNFLSMLSYMYCSSVIEQGDTSALEKFVSIYELVDSENADMKVFKSMYEEMEPND